MFALRLCALLAVAGSLRMVCRAGIFVQIDRLNHFLVEIFLVFFFGWRNHTANIAQLQDMRVNVKQTNQTVRNAAYARS